MSRRRPACRQAGGTNFGRIGQMGSTYDNRQITVSKEVKGSNPMPTRFEILARMVNPEEKAKAKRDLLQGASAIIFDARNGSPIERIPVEEVKGLAISLDSLVCFNQGEENRYRAISIENVDLEMKGRKAK